MGKKAVFVAGAGTDENAINIIHLKHICWSHENCIKLESLNVYHLKKGCEPFIYGLSVTTA